MLRSSLNSLQIGYGFREQLAIREKAGPRIFLQTAPKIAKIEIRRIEFWRHL